MKTFVIFWSIAALCKGYLIDVSPQSEDCFYEHVKTKRTAFLRIAVLDGDPMDIRLKAYGPFNEAPSEDERKQEFFNQLITTKVSETSESGVVHDGFNYDTEHRGGWYKYCLDNTHSSWNQKTVDFSTTYGLTSEDDFGHEDVKEEEEKKEHLKSIERSLDRTAAYLRLIRTEQRYFKAREKRHFQTIMSNQSRLFWFSFMEIAILAVLYGGQIYLLHQWFSDRSAGKQWA